MKFYVYQNDRNEMKFNFKHPLRKKGLSEFRTNILYNITKVSKGFDNPLVL